MLASKEISDEVIGKILANDNFRIGMLTLDFLRLCDSDIEIFNSNDTELDIKDIETRVTDSQPLLKSIPQRRSLHSFIHIFQGGYSFGYYGYKLNETIAADVLSIFVENDLNNKPRMQELGKKLLKDFLAVGSSVNPIQAIENFLGRPYNTNKLLTLLPSPPDKQSPSGDSAPSRLRP